MWKPAFSPPPTPPPTQQAFRIEMATWRISPNVPAVEKHLSWVSSCYGRDCFWQPKHWKTLHVYTAKEPQIPMDECLVQVFSSDVVSVMLIVSRCDSDTIPLLPPEAKSTHNQHFRSLSLSFQIEKHKLVHFQAICGLYVFYLKVGT